MFFTPRKIPGGQQGAMGNSVGSQALVKPSEVAGNPGGLAAGTGETKLYRVMSDAEYQSIIKNNGKFGRYDNAMEEKWFATTPADASK